MQMMEDLQLDEDRIERREVPSDFYPPPRQYRGQSGGPPPPPANMLPPPSNGPMPGRRRRQGVVGPPSSQPARSPSFKQRDPSPTQSTQSALPSSVNTKTALPPSLAPCEPKAPWFYSKVNYCLPSLTQPLPSPTNCVNAKTHIFSTNYTFCHELQRTIERFSQVKIFSTIYYVFFVNRNARFLFHNL